MSIGIVVALPEELSTLTTNKLAKGDYLALSDKILVAYAGAGSINAQAAAELLIAQGATRLISWGCAGALSDVLKPGDLVIADQLISTQALKTTTDLAWCARVSSLLATHLTVHTGALADSTHIVATQREKRQLHKQHGALAVDMESNAIARVAQQHQLPFIALRAIADPVTMDLSPAISYALNAQGEVVILKLLAYLLRHPFEIIGLLTIAKHFNAAMKTLKSVAKQLDKL